MAFATQLLTFKFYPPSVKRSCIGCQSGCGSIVSGLKKKPALAICWMHFSVVEFWWTTSMMNRDDIWYILILRRRLTFFGCHFVCCSPAGLRQCTRQCPRQARCSVSGAPRPVEAVDMATEDMTRTRTKLEEPDENMGELCSVRVKLCQTHE